MDDEEYYRKMREGYKHTPKVKKANTNFNFTTWSSRQGREDAEMLKGKADKEKTFED